MRVNREHNEKVKVERGSHQDEIRYRDGRFRQDRGDKQ